MIRSALAVERFARQRLDEDAKLGVVFLNDLVLADIEHAAERELEDVGCSGRSPSSVLI